MKELDPIQLASRDQFERRSSSYGSTHILADISDVVEALEGLALPPGSSALDIATGGGHTAAYLAGLGLAVTAADLSPAMTRSAATLAAERGLTIQTAIHPAEELPYSDEAFLLVTCRVAAHHFSDPAAFVGESVRVLQPGGHLVVIDGSVPDGAPEAEQWIHEIEKLRDPSHGRFITPEGWRKLAQGAGMAVKKLETHPLKQPDLDWYFDAAATPPENRQRVHEFVRNAPAEARQIFHLAEEHGKITWWWPRVTLVAQKLPSSKHPDQSAQGDDS